MKYCKEIYNKMLRNIIMKLLSKISEMKKALPTFKKITLTFCEWYKQYNFITYVQ